MLDEAAPTRTNMDIGAQLREAREAHGLTLTRLSQRTRVPEKALAAIERNDKSGLPPHPFSRGFVRTYAAEVDLDPDRLVRDYFAQFPEQPPATLPPTAPDIPETSWQSHSPWMGLATAVAILTLVVTAAIVMGRRSQISAELQPVGTMGESPAASATGTPSASTAPAATDRAAPSASASPAGAPTDRLVITLSAGRPCWVTATVDGKRTIYRTLQAGEKETLAGDNDVKLRFGDAGAVTWTINGRDGGVPGPNGAVRDVRITPENAATVK
jgi:cytoskeletal protein RodZ